LSGSASLEIFRGTFTRKRTCPEVTKDEGRRIAVNIARLPELLGKAERE
jgi:hypothetical protein